MLRQSAGPADHHARIALPDADLPRAGDADRRPDPDPGRGARRRGDEARSAPRPHRRAARAPDRRAVPADRSLGHAASAGGDREVRRGRAADRARGRRALEAARPEGRRTPGGHARARRERGDHRHPRDRRRSAVAVDLAVDLPEDPRARRAASLDDRVRQQPPSRRASRAAAERARGERDRSSPPRLAGARTAARGRGAPEAGRDPVPRRDLVARARNRHGRRRPRDPGRVAEIGRARPPAGRARRSRSRVGLARPRLPEVPRRPPGVRRRRAADEGRGDRGDPDPAQPTRRARPAGRGDRLAGGDLRHRSACARPARLSVRRPLPRPARERARHACRALSVRRVRRAPTQDRVGPDGRRDPGAGWGGAPGGDERRDDPGPRALRRPPGRRRRESR